MSLEFQDFLLPFTRASNLFAIELILILTYIDTLVYFHNIQFLNSVSRFQIGGTVFEKTLPVQTSLIFAFVSLLLIST